MEPGMRMIVAVLVMAVAGCAEHRPAPAPAARPEASKAAATQSGRVCALQSAGRDVLRLPVAADAACTPAEGSLGLRSREGFVTFWLVPGAGTPEQAVARVPAVIADEFK